MNSERLKELIVVGVIVAVGSGILAASGVLLGRAESDRVKSEARAFAASAGSPGTISREKNFEGGPILAAFRVRKQEKTAAYVLYLECGGFSGKARFLSLYSADGAFRSSKPVAIAENYLAHEPWPEDELLGALGDSADSGGIADTVEPIRPYGDEEAIMLRSLGQTIGQGRNAILRTRRVPK